MFLSLTTIYIIIINDVDTSNVVIIMAQHFLLSRAAKTLTLAQVFKMTDAEAETTFRKLRWPATAGEPVCPSCGNTKTWECRQSNGCPRFRCTACRKSFSITSATLFDSHKLPLRGY